MGNTCIHDSPLPWGKNFMCSSVHHWKCGAIKIGVFTEMPVKSPNRFLLNFKLALWTEIRMRAAHFLAVLSS